MAAIIALISSLMGLYSLVSADDNTTDISGDPRNLASRLSFSEISQESNQIYQGCAYSDAWSDYDNDGLIDLFSPSPTARTCCDETWAMARSPMS